ncbi:MAG: hypothetical protein LN414_07130, partial [Candidatus Thermoplasmatota archaeon]|nr:hypothetical protein [Candidatus Thermoplasmatota archaeon]
MKAVILAAGEGTRLRPLTISRPKVMLRVGDQDGDVVRVGQQLVDHPALQDVVTGDDDEVAIQVFAGCEQGMAGSQLAPLLHVLDIDA